MQKSVYGLSTGERRVVRKWRLAVFGFYGSLLAIIALSAALSHREVEVARVDPPAQLQQK
ncbi:MULTISPECIES: hypothetical protein [unclassified Bradyrhizobium]|jgi:hypothetical protein|uniref:hypothetical protein n=1 Tax=unclassified Bradyrhizobium TaxID=2631580 RepID=UPI0004B45FC8|nr:MULTISPECIES: hypothetical protein [unclassified Bradyrhizobium]MCK1329848.1 hypothetical protein [Bradyrhizobium sp. CW9]MCK1629048.1 hypothetical protein [Bradyrhizobium sp. 162]MCK1699015.1 hypothetical protein [Bradyrhizobium sp. 144]